MSLSRLGGMMLERIEDGNLLQRNFCRVARASQPSLVGSAEGRYSVHFADVKRYNVKDQVLYCVGGMY